MSRYSMCPGTYAMGQGGCASIGVDDATRVLRLLYTPARIAIVTALVVLAMLLALQFASPVAIFTAPSSGSHFAVHGSAGQEAARDVERQASQLLADLEERHGANDEADIGPRP